MSTTISPLDKRDGSMRLVEIAALGNGAHRNQTMDAPLAILDGVSAWDSVVISGTWSWGGKGSILIRK